MDYNPIGLDLATKRSGWAYKIGHKWHVGHCRGDELQPYLKLAEADGVTHAVIEDVYMGPNAKVVIALSALRGEVTAQCKALGIEPGVQHIVESEDGPISWPLYTVPIMTWKRAMLTVAGHFPLSSKDQKTQALWVARNALGIPLGDKDHDEADAACICEWARCNWRDEG